MDVSALPNSNHPEKFLQLDVGMLPATHGMFQLGALMSSQRQWQNRVYAQRSQRSRPEVRSAPSPHGSPVVFVDRYLEKHITPVTLTSNIKRNPLFADIRATDAADGHKPGPSWTVKEYDTQSTHGHLADYLKEQRSAKDLDFWLEDLYTPGFDSLLRRKEAEHRRRTRLRIVSSVMLLVCVLLVVIIVPTVVLRKAN